jgi:hypothetical protein
MRSAFSIDGSPLNDPQAETLPGLFCGSENRQSSPKLRFAELSAKVVPVWKVQSLQWFGNSPEHLPRGNKVLLTMFARQLFPSSRANERFR